jgi:hypothetical protein
VIPGILKDDPRCDNRAGFFVCRTCTMSWNIKTDCRRKRRLQFRGNREQWDKPMTIAAADSFLQTVLSNPLNQLLIERLPEFGLQDAWLVAGCLFQTAWNAKAGSPATSGIRDYDIFYFDREDISWEAENENIRRVSKMLSDVAVNVELKNQARVHLWYAERFGVDYPQLNSVREGIDRFLIGCTRVGIRPNNCGNIEIYAPEGLSDLYQGILRPNPLNYQPKLFLAKAQSYKDRWPWLRVEYPDWSES